MAQQFDEFTRTDGVFTPAVRADGAECGGAQHVHVDRQSILGYQDRSLFHAFQFGVVEPSTHGQPHQIDTGRVARPDTWK